MEIDKYILGLCKRALLSSNESGKYCASLKNKVLKSISNYIIDDTKKIITANNVDIDNATKKGLKDSMIEFVEAYRSSSASRCAFCVIFRGFTFFKS